MKKLKRVLSYTLYLVLATVFFTSCGSDKWGCYESVKKEFPKAIEIKQPIGESWRFVVIDYDSSVYYVETMNITNDDVTQKELMFKFK